MKRCEKSECPRGELGRVNNTASFRSPIPSISIREFHSIFPNTRRRRSTSEFRFSRLLRRTACLQFRDEIFARLLEKGLRDCTSGQFAIYEGQAGRFGIFQVPATSKVTSKMRDPHRRSRHFHPSSSVFSQISASCSVIDRRDEFWHRVQRDGSLSV